MESQDTYIPNILAQAQVIQASDLPETDKAHQLYDLLEKTIRASKQADMELLSAKKRSQTLSRDAENLYADISKEKQIHGKLETLCRDLQREKKALAEESKRLVDEEERKRAELAKKVQDTLDEIQRKVEESSAERVQLAQEKEELTAKMNELFALNDQKDKDFQAAMQSKEEVVNEEKSHMQNRITELLQGASGGPEQQMRAQLQEYKQKFETFQQSLVQNNENFVLFKKELQATHKKIQGRDKENADLKKKLQQSQTYVTQMQQELSQIESENATLAKQKDVLSKLLAQLSS